MKKRISLVFLLCLLLMFSFTTFVPKVKALDPMYEYYSTGDDLGIYFYGNCWKAQTFTPSTAHNITHVKLKMHRSGSPGTLTVGIRAVNGEGKPTGSDLTNGTINANTFTTSSSGAWYQINLTSYSLSADTQYAIVCRALDGDMSNFVSWRADYSSPTYAGGITLDSGDSGSSWTPQSAMDCMFEEYGEASPGWLSGWDKRVKLTIDNTDIGETLTNFPVLVYLSTSSGRGPDDVSFIFDEVGANSLKIAFTTSDGETELYGEVEKWDFGNEQAWLWVKVPSISSSVNTDFYMYYDNDHADNTDYIGIKQSTPAQNVWDNNFLLVLHLDETGGDGTTRYDSTSNDNDFTAVDITTPDATGKIDGADDFSQANTDYHERTTNNFNLQVFTIEGWLNRDSDVDYDTLLRVSTAAGPSGWHIRVKPEDVLQFEGINGAGGVSWTISSTGTLAIDTWYYVVGTFAGNGETAYAYIDGTQDGSTTGETNVYGTSVARIGATPQGSHWFDGTIDELRFSNVTRSASWIAATWESGIDDLIDFGVEEENPPPTYSDVGKNTTIAGASCLFYTKWTDDTNMSGYIFCTNNTGSWENDTWTAWSPPGTPKWSNVTKTLNITIGITIQWWFEANDTGNNWNSTDIQSFVTTAYATITFYYNSTRGVFKVNGEEVSPNDTRGCYYNESVSLLGLAWGGFEFGNFTWNNGSSTSTPYTLYVTDDWEVWANFNVADVATKGFFVGAIAVGLIILIPAGALIWVATKRK